MFKKDFCCHLHRFVLLIILYLYWVEGNIDYVINYVMCLLILSFFLAVFIHSTVEASYCDHGYNAYYCAWINLLYSCHFVLPYLYILLSLLSMYMYFTNFIYLNNSLTHSILILSICLLLHELKNFVKSNFELYMTKFFCMLE